MFQFVKKQEITECLDLSDTTLKNYRLKGVWLEDIHWKRINSRVRYNLELIQDWFINRHDLAAHQRAIEIYLASLLSNQKSPKKASRKS